MANVPEGGWLFHDPAYALTKSGAIPLGVIPCLCSYCLC